MSDPGQPDGGRSHGRHAHQHHLSRPEALERVPNERDEGRSHEVEHGDRRRDGARGLAMARDQLGQEDTDSVEAEPPSEHGNQKGTGDHLPSVVQAAWGRASSVRAPMTACVPVDS